MKRRDKQVFEYRDSKGVLLHQWDKVEVVAGDHKGDRGQIRHLEGGNVVWVVFEGEVYEAEKQPVPIFPSLLRRVFVHPIFGETEVILGREDMPKEVEEFWFAAGSASIFVPEINRGEVDTNKVFREMRDRVVKSITEAFNQSEVLRVYILQDLMMKSDESEDKQIVQFTLSAGYAFLRKKPDA